MERVVINQALSGFQGPIFAGDHEVTGPTPWLGHATVADLGCNFNLIHYHHRHEFDGGRAKGLWGTVCPKPGVYAWGELDRTVAHARTHFPLVGLYPIGWAHMVPNWLGETILDVSVDVAAEWVATVVNRYHESVAVFPVFYELNVFDLFYRQTHHLAYDQARKEHIVRILTHSYELVTDRCGADVAAKLAVATFVELTHSSFYWMSEGKLLELPRGSSLLGAPLSPPDLLATARQLDQAGARPRHESALRQMLHQLIFWNADDSGARNTVGDDLYRIYEAGWFDADDGFARLVIAGWDAQPQNTYEYLLARMWPELHLPTTAACLLANYRDYRGFLADNAVPFSVRSAIRGFVLDDIFKCRKQSGITSAVFPTELVGPGGLRIGSVPLTESPLGQAYREITDRRTGPDRWVEVRPVAHTV